MTKLYRRNYDPEMFFFVCHYGSRRYVIDAESPHVARMKAAAYFGVGSDKIRVRRA